MHHILFAIVVTLSSGKPVVHALVSCAEIVRQVDERPTGEEDGGSAVLLTDSKGWMVFSAEPGTFHCMAWKDKLRWSGAIEIPRDGVYTVVIK